MIDSSRFLPRFLTIAFGLTLTIQTGTGQDLTWDVGSGDGATVTDGTGTWTDLNGNWNDGATDATWNNGLPNNAIFGGGTSGTAGLVTLGSSITTGSLTFNPPSAGSYTIDTSTFGLTLNGNVVANTSALIQSGGGGGLTLGTSIDWNVASGEEVTVSSIIGGGANGITKSGEGTLILSGTNTFTGRAQVDGGTLRVVDNAITTSNANAIREYGPIADGAVLEFQYNGVPEFNNTGIVNLSGDGTFRKTGSATLTQISGGATIAMGSDALIHIAEGTYAFGAQGVGNWNSNLSDFRVDAGATYQGGATPTIVDAIDGAGTIIVGGGNGTSTVGNGFTMGVDGGSGTFSGTLTNSGAYGPNSIRKEGGGTQILSGNNDYNGITTIIGGVLQIGDGVAATGTLGTGDTVNNASLVFNHTGNHTYAGSISGTGTVTKNGSGFQALNGDNTYGSPTQVNAGTLNIGGTNTSTFTIANGANFGGEGSTTGDLIFQGTHTVTTDADPAAALTTSGQLNLDLVPAGGITLDITGFGSGEIVLINYGTLSGLPAAGNFTLGSHTPSNRLVGAPTIQDNGSGSITTNLGYVVNTWQGNDPTNANFWDVNTTANWSNSSPDSVFHTNDDVVFGDSAASFNPTLQSSLSAASVTFENDSNAYTLSDLGAGVETLTIVNALNLTGDAEVTLDATIVSNGPAAISGGGNVTISQPFAINGGLNISGSGDVTISGLLSGTTELVKSGTGTTLITGDNNGYTGVMTVNAGTLALQNTAINNSRTYGPIAQGATLEFRMNAGGADPANLNISGAGTFLKTGNQTLSQISANNSIAMDSGGLFHLAEGAYIFGAGGIGFWNQNLGDLLMGPGFRHTDPVRCGQRRRHHELRRWSHPRGRRWRRDVHRGDHRHRRQPQRQHRHSQFHRQEWQRHPGAQWCQHLFRNHHHQRRAAGPERHARRRHQRRRRCQHRRRSQHHRQPHLPRRGSHPGGRFQHPRSAWLHRSRRP
jgi:autotransporter-associated beta strand protein